MNSPFFQFKFSTQTVNLQINPLEPLYMNNVRSELWQFVSLLTSMP